MRPIRVSIAVIAAFSMFLISGCTFFRAPETSKKTPTPKSEPTTSAATPASTTLNPATKGDINRRNIKIDNVPTIIATAGDKDGVELHQNVDATHLCDGKPIVKIAFGTPDKGITKSYPNGSWRYYPPGYACEDILRSILICDDGCTKEFDFKISVTSSTGEIPKIEEGAGTKAKPTDGSEKIPVKRVSTENIELQITSPTDHSRSQSYICRVEGTAPSNLEGVKLTLAVINNLNTTYIQDSRPTVKNGEFSGSVYLGETDGRGIGEEFTILAQTDAGVFSNFVTVTRTE